MSSARARGSVRWLRVVGELDSVDAPRFAATVTPLVAPPSHVITLDLAGLWFCDAAGLRALLHLREIGARQQVQVVLTAAHPAVRHVLRAVGEQAWLRTSP
ncbi:STAS domain-containing protein [Actinoplanes sp. NPDC051859]|uniref:STAS domain-containing protein n=1 Tax=Actinoplanes sp. NPDC051859 TaxID=3363909 RepID=UPI00378C0C94